MSAATDDLRAKVQDYRLGVLALGTARRERDEAKRQLKDHESGIFYQKVTDGTIDGKNAETREAQAQIAYKANTGWQQATDRYRRAEESFLDAQDTVTITLTELRVAATLVNAEIAETGATRLLAEVSLAGV